MEQVRVVGGLSFLTILELVVAAVVAVAVVVVVAEVVAVEVVLTWSVMSVVNLAILPVNVAIVVVQEDAAAVVHLLDFAGVQVMVEGEIDSYNFFWTCVLLFWHLCLMWYISWWS